MYQLKGRVGRSSAQAYAYFMFPDNVNLTEEATARLEAINEHRDLGSGMRIAMRDLEIRGAGSLLGAEQSGNMSQVGFDLFAQMLAQAVTDAREGVTTGDGLPPALSDITVNLPRARLHPRGVRARRRRARARLPQGGISRHGGGGGGGLCRAQGSSSRDASGYGELLHEGAHQGVRQRARHRNRHGGRRQSGHRAHCAAAWRTP